MCYGNGYVLKDSKMVQTGLCERVNKKELKFPAKKDSNIYDNYNGECIAKKGDSFVRRPRQTFNMD